jgi:hypothetical protein
MAKKRATTSAAINPDAPRSKTAPGKAGLDPWGYLPDANGVSQPVYIDPATNQIVDGNGLPLTNSGNAENTVSPLAGGGHVPYNDDYLLSNEFGTDRTAVNDKALAAKRAGKDPDVELTPAEKRQLGYSTTDILPGVKFVDGNDANYVAAQKGTLAPSTQAYPGYNGTPALAGQAGAPGATGAGGAPGSTDDWLSRLLAEAEKNRTENTSFVDKNLVPEAQKADAAQQQAAQARLGNVGTAADLYGGFVNNNNDILNQQRTAANQANQNDLGYLQTYQGQLANLGAANQANYGQLASAYGNYSQLAPSASSQWQGDLTSQAAGAQADPQAIAAQYQALGQLQSAASGGLNTTSQAAQAYADPQAVQMQMRGINDLYGASKGSLDVQLDPELWSKQTDALNQYGALTTPQLTAQEEFMKELARTQQEQDEGASRSAMLRSNAAKGFGGQMDLAALQGASQQNSTNRMLGDLGANANAVARSMQALQGYAGQGNSMQGQYLANAHANQDVQLSALGMYTDAAGNLRSQTFDEAYKRGLAGDQTAMANADRMLQAAGMSADTAGNIRQQSFNEDYSRGLAADNMSQYNRTTSLAASQWSDQYRADQQNSAWGRDTDMFGAGIQTIGTQSNLDSQGFNANRLTNQGNYGRTGDTLGLQNQLGLQNLQGGNQVLDRSDAAWQNFGNQAQQNFGNWMGIAGQRQGASAQGSAAVQDAIKQNAGQAATNQAITAIQNGPKPSAGILDLLNFKWI